MIFAGGRPGIHAVLAFLKEHVQVRISNTEWPAYLDIMTASRTNWSVVPCNLENDFRPSNAQYFDRAGLNAKTTLFPIISNPGNPTGHTRAGAELEELVGMAEQRQCGILLDEAYEMYHRPAVSGLQFVSDLENSNVFIAGACTKGLRVRASASGGSSRPSVTSRFCPILAVLAWAACRTHRSSTQ